MPRHLLSAAHFIEETALHLARATKSSSNPKIMGLPLNVFIMLAGGIAICLTICCCIWVAYRRRRARIDFNENPEQFPNLPNLSWGEERTLKNKDMKAFIKTAEPLVIEKRTEDYQGPYYRCVFKGTGQQAVIFNHEQKKGYSYF